MGSETKNIASIGFLCEQARRNYFDVLQSLTAAGVRPVLVIDLVPHFDWCEASRVLEVNAPMIHGAANG